MGNKMDVKKFTNEVEKTKDISELVKKVLPILSSNDVFRLIDFTFKVTEDLKKENLLVYNKSVVPLLVIVSDVEKELKIKDISVERREKLYTTLFQAQKDIAIESGKFRTSKKRDLSVLGKGAALGALALAVAYSIFGKNNSE